MPKVLGSRGRNQEITRFALSETIQAAIHRIAPAARVFCSIAKRLPGFLLAELPPASSSAKSVLIFNAWTLKSYQASCSPHRSSRNYPGAPESRDVEVVGAAAGEECDSG